MTEQQEQALQLATDAGHILLENGAEIRRVESTMKHIASAYGIDDESFFVLSNGIIATGQHYARAEFIPIKGTQLARVVEVNQLSRDVNPESPMPLDVLAARLHAIRTRHGKPWWENVTGIAVGVAAFCIIFGGSLPDALATFVCGLMLGAFMTFVGPHLSRIFGNLLGGIAGGTLCIAAARLFPGVLHLPNMVIGTIIALVPGVPFTGGLRDLADEDYIAGATRLLDAFLAFLCIALGVMTALVVDGYAYGGLLELDSPTIDSVTSEWYIQLAAALLGTVGFSVLFGAPRRYYLSCGLTGMIGWGVFLLASTHLTVTVSAGAGALAVAATSILLAGLHRCPVTVFLVCGIIPLVPGGGIFWTAYHLVTNHLRLAATTGFTALKVAVAIAGGIIVATAVYNMLRRPTPRRAA